MFEYRKKTKPYLLIAAGGTGGHLFPAQRLGRDLLEKDIDLLIAGHGLTASKYFQQQEFSYIDIPAKNPSAKGLKAKIIASISLLKGIVYSWKILKKNPPDLLIGFGSFHSFPLLCAAWLLKIPYFLFEPNSLPGKVNRLFSASARLSCVQFEEIRPRLKGNILEVAMPLVLSNKNPEEARCALGLAVDKMTLLIFGGSQGAMAVNQIFCKHVAEIQKKYPDLQIIHLTGSEDERQTCSHLYQSLNISCYVKTFEKEMSDLWKAADLVIARAGAMTMAEQIATETPGILIPFPLSSENHQQENASFMANYVKGAIELSEETAFADLSRVVDYLLSSERKALKEMKEAIRKYKQNREKPSLASVILKELCTTS